MTKKYIKIPEYARMVDLSSQYVRRIIAKGIITKKAIKKKGKRVLVDPVQANIDREKNHAPENRKPKLKPTVEEKETVSKQAGTRTMDYNEARRLNEQYKAGLKKLDYDQKSGRLIPADEVEREYFDIARTVRDSLMNIPGRINAILAAEIDEVKVNEILTQEITQALEVLSK